MLPLILATMLAQATLESPRGSLAREVSDRLVAEIEERLALGPSARVEVLRLDVADPTALRKGRLIELELATKGRPLGWVTARARVSHNKREREIWLRAEIVANAPTVVATRAIGRGEALRDSDLRFAMLPVTEDRIDDASLVVGSIARWPIGEGEVIARRGLERPLAVTRGTSVLAVVEQPGFVIKAPAEAMDNGAIGDEVQVRLGASKKVVRAVVIAQDEVEVRR